MKKTMIILLSVLALFSVKASAEQTPGTPQVLVTGYTVENGTVRAGTSAKMTVTLKNMSRTVPVGSVTFSFSDPSGVLTVSGVDAAYVAELAPSGEFAWTFSVYAAPSAESGEYTARVSAEFDSSGGRMTTGGNVAVKVAADPASTPDLSAVRLAVKGYETENGGVTPGEKRVITVKLKNMNAGKAAKNAVLKLTDPSGDIVPDDLGAAYVSSIAAGAEYVWKIPAEAIFSAAVGRHTLLYTAEYEDENGAAYSDSETLYVDVIQSVSLEADNVLLPSVSVQGDTVSLSAVLMNTGKSDLFNCRTVCSVEGLSTGGTVFVGEIKTGESASAVTNFRVDNEKTGEVEGTLTLTYEDAFGRTYSDVFTLSTTIKEKTVTDKTGTEEKKDVFRWVLFALGIVLGGGIGCAVPLAVYAAKQRRIDEERL